MVDFAADELVQALGEVGWGFKTWEILPTIPYEASARLELLEEGWWIVVCVSERGWEVVERHTAEVSAFRDSVALCQYRRIRFDTAGGGSEYDV